MILLIIAYLLLLYVEIFGEVIFGDKHDKNSNLRLAATLLLATAMGLLIECYYGLAIYLGLRLLLFDISFGYLFKGDMWYLGTTSKWDIYKRKLINKMKRIYDYIKGLDARIKFWSLAAVGVVLLALIPQSTGVWTAYAICVASLATIIHFLVKK